ncbi:MAG: hypothetical protein ACE3JP_16860 [Ectobacillus sp.]
MINSNNKLILFELIYRLRFAKENIQTIELYVAQLQKELQMLEGADIAVLNPEEFEGELRAEWNRFFIYRQGEDIN